MTGKLSTHVLDISTGKPAAGMRVQLYWVEPHTEVLIRATATNADGRTDGPMVDGERFSAGMYKLVFHVGDYFIESHHADAKRFLDIVPLVFVVDDASKPYHVPLLVSPWAYSTYRGS
ncbi:hydroxyisourate hydrolase [soil metagenome]